MTKSTIHQHCIDSLMGKIQTCKNMLASLDESAASDGKSSAGDKFETSREMIQQERDRIDIQLSQLYKQLNILSTIDISERHTKVDNGALVTTDSGMFYISVPIGKVKIQELSQLAIYAISPESPMAQKLWLQEVGSTIMLNNKQITINHIS